MPHFEFEVTISGSGTVVVDAEDEAAARKIIEAAEVTTGFDIGQPLSIDDSGYDGFGELKIDGVELLDEASR